MENDSRIHAQKPYLSQWNWNELSLDGSSSLDLKISLEERVVLAHTWRCSLSNKFFRSMVTLIMLKPRIPHQVTSTRARLVYPPSPPSLFKNNGLVEGYFSYASRRSWKTYRIQWNQKGQTGPSSHTWQCKTWQCRWRPVHCSRVCQGQFQFWGNFTGNQGAESRGIKAAGWSPEHYKVELGDALRGNQLVVGAKSQELYTHTLLSIANCNLFRLDSWESASPWGNFTGTICVHRCTMRPKIQADAKAKRKTKSSGCAWQLTK